MEIQGNERLEISSLSTNFVSHDNSIGLEIVCLLRLFGGGVFPMGLGGVTFLATAFPLP